MQPHRRMEAREWIYLITLAVLWSQVFLLTRIALGDMRPFTVVALRLGLGSLMLYCAVLCSGERMPLALRTWAAFITMGALNNVIPFCLIAWGQTQIASGLAAIRANLHEIA